jgi:hypothetical protein
MRRCRRRTELPLRHEKMRRCCMLLLSQNELQLKPTVIVVVEGHINFDCIA